MRRRRFFAQVAAILAAPVARRASAQTIDSNLAELRELTGGQPIRRGRVTLELPQLADNGNAIPVRIAVESPMTESDHVRSLHVYAERNPRRSVATFYFGPQSGRAVIATRMRLAGSQRVIAAARMSDGSLWGTTADVVVTLSACLDES